MPFDQELSRHSFERLERHLSKLPKTSAPETVHRFRTYSRRVEVLLGETGADLSGNQKKLLKLLARFRKKAGRLRDLDVQNDLLRSLKTPQAPGQKSQLQRVLGEERARREKKLRKAFDEETVAEMRKRLRRAEREIDIPEDLDPVAIAMGLFNQVRVEGPMTEEILHQYRIAGKRARYVAELAGDTPSSHKFVEQLKHMQDVIGTWHDWLQLTERAEALFGNVQESPLVAELRNVTQAKFREAVRVLGQTKVALGAKPMAYAADRRRPARSQAVSSAA